MIWVLLKQMPTALARYLIFSFRRFFGITSPSHITPARSTPEEDSDIFLNVGLAESLVEDTSWPAHMEQQEPQELRDLALFQLWLTIPNGFKWSQYFPVYETIFSEIRHQPLSVLEIGVYRGSSLQLWREYFDHHNTVIVGIDIDAECAKYDEPQNAKHVMIGDQTDPTFLETVVSRHGPFDIIIDDGSHISGHIITSFNHLFQAGLKETGIYLVEDLHTHYFPDYRNSRLGFIDVAKQIVDLMHSHYRKVPFLVAYRKDSEDYLTSIDVPRIATLVQEIRFFDSIVAISKARVKNVPHITITNYL